MTAAYFDSSALVKLVIDEQGSEEAALLWDGADVVATSRVAHPEVRAALAAARRSNRLDADLHLAAKAAWDELRASIRLVELTADVEAMAAELAEDHGLSGFDAIHLSSALVLSELDVVVATWDVRLHRAAGDERLRTLPRTL
jgi:predicted nucleic acid-binding protein